jgi:uncharacterized membrane protein SpoIIM required for sporulation
MTETQDQFVARRRADWDELGRLVAGGGAWHALAPATIARAAALYRSVTADLMRARSLGFASDLAVHLDGLAARAHAALYSAPPYRLGAVRDLLARDFPRTLRRHWRFMAFATALFLLPAVVGFAGARRSRAFALQVLPEAMVLQVEESFSKDPSDSRGATVNSTMAGFYVYNNVGIAFRCFATGILFGLGSVFFLVYNGLILGAVVGLLLSAGHLRNLLTFVLGHGAFELTAIVIAGAAGLVMGYALVSTDGLTRFGSLRRRARDVANLVLGAAMMLLIAAGIEAFWSPSPVPSNVKLSVAGALWLLVIAYFVFAGRRGSPSSTSTSTSTSTLSSTSPSTGRLTGATKAAS